MADNKMPSLLALLGLLAVAGYQNRDKIGQVLGQVGGGSGAGAGTGTGAGGDNKFGETLNDAGNVVGRTASEVGGSLKNGLDELLSTFRNAGQQETADSWVTPGVPTQGLSTDQVETALGRDTLTALAQKAGISYDELVQRLASVIPQAVDRATPDGNFPATDQEVRQRVIGS
ncbi:DUF937 domain-containing protein [Devosia sp. D6-9]|nr:DUF937 domain-containing protein [Devosia sp. D6-9]